MRTIQVKSWKAKMPDGNEVEESILDVLNALINAKSPDKMPRGMDSFRLFTRLVKSFDDAKTTQKLVLEEADYAFLKHTIMNDIPAAWGMNPNITGAVQEFIDAKEE